MKAFLISLACLLFGTLAGWFSLERPDAPPTGSPSTRFSSRMAQERQRAKSSALPSEVASRLSLINAARTPEERLLAVIHLAQTLPVSDFARWYEAKWLSQSAKGTLVVFQEILRERWLEENPAELLQVALQRNWNYAPDLAGQWASLDPDAALAFLNGLPEDEKHSTIRCKVAISIARERPEEAIAIIAAYGTPGTKLAKWDDAILELARHHPQLLESAKLPDGLAERVPVMLAASRLEQDFSAGLQALLDSPEGLVHFSQIIGNDGKGYSDPAAFSEELLRHLDHLPPEWLQKLATLWFIPTNPEAWLAVDFIALGLSETDATSFRDKLWSARAGMNPESILEAFAKSPSDAASPSASLLFSSLQLLYWRSPDAYQKHLDQLLGTITDPKLLQGLEEWRQNFEQMCPTPWELRNTAPLLHAFSSGATLTEQEIDQMKQYFKSLRLATPEELREVQGKLSAMEPSKLAKLGSLIDDLHNSLPLHDRARIVAAMIARQPADPADSQDYQVTPDGESPAVIHVGSGGTEVDRMASSIATSMLGKDSLAAGRWVAGLPAGNARTWASRNLAHRWLKIDAPAANRWIDSLPDTERAELRKFIEADWSRR